MVLSAYGEHHCQHRSDDFPIIRELLRAKQPGILIELGTDRGGFAAMLADLADEWGAHVITYDIEAKFGPTLLGEHPNLHFVKADVLTNLNTDLAVILRGGDGVQSCRAFLYCDNGNKPREVELYAPHLSVGSILGVHDYNTEIMATWVEPYVASLGFEPYGHDKFEALRNQWYPEPMTRFWLRTHNPHSTMSAVRLTNDTIIRVPVVDAVNTTRFADCCPMHA